MQRLKFGATNVDDLVKHELHELHEKVIHLHGTKRGERTASN